MSQTIATTPGQAYVVSYWLAVGSDSTGLVFTPNDFSASFGRQTLFSQSNLPATDGHADSADDYTQYSFTTVASSASSALLFGFRDDNAYLRLDDISVTPAAVPEASTTLTLSLLLTLGSLTVLACRKRSAKTAV